MYWLAASWAVLQAGLAHEIETSAIRFLQRARVSHTLVSYAPFQAPASLASECPVPTRRKNCVNGLCTHTSAHSPERCRYKVRMGDCSVRGTEHKTAVVKPAQAYD